MTDDTPLLLSLALFAAIGGVARVVFTQTVACALLLGTLHWTTLRGSVRLRTHLTRAASDRSR